METVMNNSRRECTRIQESHFGFIPGLSTADAIFELQQTVEQHREGQKVINLVFINLHKD